MKILASLILILTATAAQAASPMVDVIARVKPGVVGVGTYNKLGQPQSELLGTGFAVADGRHVITAAHVVDSQSLDRRAKLSVFVGEGEDAMIRSATVKARDRAHDIVLLSIDGGALPVLTLSDGPNLPDGTEIAFTGFPIGAVYGLYPATHRGMIAASAPIARPQASPGELTADMIRALNSNIVAYQLDATSFPGNSGGPVYEAATGRVIGIVNSTFVQQSKENALERPSGVTFAIPIGPAIALLRANGLAP